MNDPKKSRPRPRGRRREPVDRAAASARALAAISFDPAAELDELQILRTIAADSSLAPTARVQACKAIAAARERRLPSAGTSESEDLHQRALKLMKGGRA